MAASIGIAQGSGGLGLQAFDVWHDATRRATARASEMVAALAIAVTIAVGVATATQLSWAVSLPSYGDLSL